MSELQRSSAPRETPAIAGQLQRHPTPRCQAVRPARYARPANNRTGMISWSLPCMSCWAISSSVCSTCSPAHSRRVRDQVAGRGDLAGDLREVVGGPVQAGIAHVDHAHVEAAAVLDGGQAVSIRAGASA
jgi:hypothetical protein